MTLGGRLRRLIAFRKQSIAAFATQASIPYKTLQNYLADRRKPSADHLIRLHRVRIDILWLLTGRCGPPLDDYLPLGEEQPLAAFGEREFAESLIWQAALAADQFQIRYHKKTGAILRRLEAEVVLSHFVQMYAARAADLTDVIEKMGATDFAREDVVKVLVSSATQDSDDRLHQKVEVYRALEFPGGSRVIFQTEGFQTEGENPLVASRKIAPGEV